MIILPRVPKHLRIPIVLSMLVLEIVGFTQAYKFYLVGTGHDVDDFIRLIFISQTGFWLLVAYLWNDWLQLHGIRFFEVFLIVTFGFSSIFMFGEGDPMKSAFYIVIFLGSVSYILPRLFRPLGKFLEERNSSSAGEISSEPPTEAKARPIRNGIVLLALVLLLLWAVWQRTDGAIPTWLLVAFPLPLLLYALVDYLTRHKKQRDLHKMSESTTKMHPGDPA